MATTTIDRAAKIGARPIVTHPGNDLVVSTEFPRRVFAGHRVQFDQTCRQPKGLGNRQTAGLVEGNVAVTADSQKLDVQPAVSFDPAVVFRGVPGHKCLGDGAVKQVSVTEERYRPC